MGLKLICVQKERREFQNSPTLGHLGITNTKKSKEGLYGVNYWQSVAHWIGNCMVYIPYSKSGCLNSGGGIVL